MHEIKREEIMRCLVEVYQSLDKYDYNPINQLIGYLISGDPTYVTAKERARYKIQEFDREDILAEIVDSFIEGLDEEKVRNIRRIDTHFYFEQVI